MKAHLLGLIKRYFLKSLETRFLTRRYVYETVCSQQMLDSKDGQINEAQLLVQYFIFKFKNVLNSSSSIQASSLNMSYKVAMTNLKRAIIHDCLQNSPAIQPIILCQLLQFQAFSCIYKIAMSKINGLFYDSIARMLAMSVKVVFVAAAVIFVAAAEVINYAAVAFISVAAVALVYDAAVISVAAVAIVYGAAVAVVNVAASAVINDAAFVLNSVVANADVNDNEVAFIQVAATAVISVAAVAVIDDTESAYAATVAVISLVAVANVAAVDNAVANFDTEAIINLVALVNVAAVAVVNVASRKYHILKMYEILTSRHPGLDPAI